MGIRWIVLPAVDYPLHFSYQLSSVQPAAFGLPKASASKLLCNNCYIPNGCLTMITGVMREETYRDYRRRLGLLLHIPIVASDQDIHEYIEAGFLPDCAVALFKLGAIGPSELNRIIPLRVLKTRMATRRRLTLRESDCLFRFAHVIASAIAIFGNENKATRWLSKPKARFSGRIPFLMLSTLQGTRLVEEMLMEIADAF